MTDEQKQHVEALCLALESGAFVQGRGRLLKRAADHSKPDEWCCLGVACEVFRTQTGRGEWVPPPSHTVGLKLMTFDVEGEQNGCYMPAKVGVWFGFDPEQVADEPAAALKQFHGLSNAVNPLLNIVGLFVEERKRKEELFPGLPATIRGVVSPLGSICASVLNDSYDWDFKMIAQALRKTYLDADQE